MRVQYIAKIDNWDNLILGRELLVNVDNLNDSILSLKILAVVDTLRLEYKDALKPDHITRFRNHYITIKVQDLSKSITFISIV